METEFLKNILKSISVSGYEEPLQNIVREEMQNVADEIREDEMHNLVCVANPDSPVRILLSAHADEIGLMISNITEDGRQRRRCRSYLSGTTGDRKDKGEGDTGRCGGISGTF